MENKFLDLFRAYTDLLKFKKEKEDYVKAKREALEFQRTNARVTPRFILKYDDGHRGSYPHTDQHLITLDEVDIEYFKNKYFSKLKEEKEKEINEVKSNYNALLSEIEEADSQKISSDNENNNL